MKESLVRTKDFYGRDFLISPDVLVPRPETEQMIDMVLALSGRAYLPGMAPPARELPEQPVILDVGTGSGCIAVTLALEMPEAKVYALDISPEALIVARENARKLGAEVEFCQSDLLLDYDGPEPDVICANLPYVDKDWEWVDTEALSAEPALALYAEDGGMALAKKLLQKLAICFSVDASARPIVMGEPRSGSVVTCASPQKSTSLIFELDPCQHGDVIRYAEQWGFRHVETRGFIMRFIRNTRQG